MAKHTLDPLLRGGRGLGGEDRARETVRICLPNNIIPKTAVFVLSLAGGFVRKIIIIIEKIIDNISSGYVFHPTGRINLFLHFRFRKQKKKQT